MTEVCSRGCRCHLFDWRESSSIGGDKHLEVGRRRRRTRSAFNEGCPAIDQMEPQQHARIPRQKKESKRFTFSSSFSQRLRRRGRGIKGKVSSVSLVALVSLFVPWNCQISSSGGEPPFADGSVFDIRTNYELTLSQERLENGDYIVQDPVERDVTSAPISAPTPPPSTMSTVKDGGSSPPPGRTSTLSPSRATNRVQTRTPTAWPTFNPDGGKAETSPQPSSVKKLDSFYPSAKPTWAPTTRIGIEELAVSATDNRTTEARWKEVSVPVDFLVHAIVTAPTTLERIRTLLEEFLLQALLAWEAALEINRQFSGVDAVVKVFHVNLKVALNSSNITTPTNQGDYNNGEGGKRRRTRSLQQASSDPRPMRSLRVVGMVLLKVDSQSVNPEEVSADVNNELDNNILIPKQIQSPLEAVGLEVTAVDNLIPPVVAAAQQEEGVYTGHIPTTAEIVVAMLLIIAMAASLVFWASVFWKKRQKRIRKRRLAAMRKAQSYVMPERPPSQHVQQRSSPVRLHSSALIPARPPNASLGAANGNVSGPKTFTNADDSSSSESSFQGVGTSEDSEDSENGDPFARALQKAASLDQMAWQEFVRRKKQLESRRGNFLSTVTPSQTGTTGPAACTENYVPEGNNASLLEAVTVGSSSSQDQGIEVAASGGIHRIGSFPYGDENELKPAAPSSPAATAKLEKSNPDAAMALTADKAVKWTAAGVSLGMTMLDEKKDDNEDEEAPSSEVNHNRAGLDRPWEPYGDGGANNSQIRGSDVGESLEESWNLQESPILAGNEANNTSQYSFVYPLRERDLTADDGIQVSSSRDDLDDETPSSAAVRDSPTMSSLSTAIRTSPPASTGGTAGSRLFGKLRKDDDDSSSHSSDSSQVSQSYLTMEMLKEVEQLSKYVQRYEKKKQQKKEIFLQDQDDESDKVIEKPERHDNSNLSSSLSLDADTPPRRLLPSILLRSRNVPSPADDGTISHESLLENSFSSAAAATEAARKLLSKNSNNVLDEERRSDSMLDTSLGSETTTTSNVPLRLDSTVELEDSTSASAQSQARDTQLQHAAPTVMAPEARQQRVAFLDQVEIAGGSSEYGDDESTEGDTATANSHRLGINRFHVQKEPPKLSFQQKLKEPDFSTLAHSTVPNQPGDQDSRHQITIEDSNSHANYSSSGHQQHPSQQSSPQRRESERSPGNRLLDLDETGFPVAASKSKHDSGTGCTDLTKPQQQPEPKAGLTSQELQEREQKIQRQRQFYGGMSSPTLESSPACRASSGTKAKLSTLRSTTAILDDEDAGNANHVNLSSANDAALDEAARRDTTPPPSRTAGGQQTLVQNSQEFASPTTRIKRSKNKNFSHIVNMFESKPKTPIQPPNASWKKKG